MRRAVQLWATWFAFLLLVSGTSLPATGASLILSTAGDRGLIRQPADLAAIHLEYLEAARPSAAAPGSGTSDGAPAVGMSQSRPLAAPSGVQPRPKVRIGELGIVPAGMVYIAEAKGYFAEQGLDVEFQRFDAGPSMIPALSTGQIEVASSGINLGTFNAMARELPIVLVADSGYDGRDTSVIVRADLRGHLQRPADLAGRRVAINGPGTILEYMLGRAVERDGSRWDAVDVQYIPFPDMRTALDNGAAEVVYPPEPFPTLMDRAGTGYRWLDGQALVPDPLVQTGAIAYNRTWASSQPMQARGVAMAILRGIREMISAAEGGANRAEVIDILVEHTPVKDRALYDFMSWPGLHRNGELSIDSIVDQQQWYASHGQLPRPADVTRFIDLSYISAAATQLGPYSGPGGY